MFRMYVAGHSQQIFFPIFHLFIYYLICQKTGLHQKALACAWVLPQTHTATNTTQSTLYKTSTKQIIIS